MAIRFCGKKYRIRLIYAEFGYRINGKFQFGVKFRQIILSLLKNLNKFIQKLVKLRDTWSRKIYYHERKKERNEFLTQTDFLGPERKNAFRLPMVTFAPCHVARTEPWHLVRWHSVLRHLVQWHLVLTPCLVTFGSYTLFDDICF